MAFRLFIIALATLVGASCWWFLGGQVQPWVFGVALAVLVLTVPTEGWR